MMYVYRATNRDILKKFNNGNISNCYTCTCPIRVLGKFNTSR